MGSKWHLSPGITGCTPGPGQLSLQYVPLIARGSEGGHMCLDLYGHITAHGKSMPAHSDNGENSGAIFLEGISWFDS